MNKFIEIVEEIKSIVSSDFNGKRIFDKDVADVLGISQMNFATMKKREKIPFTELLDFCATKSISINWLLYGQSPESLVEATNKFFMVKYFIDSHASAGGGSDSEYEDAQEVEIPAEFVSLLGGEKELKYIEALNVTGDSMEPTFSNADIVFVNRDKTDIQRGGVFASVYGVYKLLPKKLRKNVIGVIINKFQGDMSLFDEGVRIIESRFGIKVLGVVPFRAFNLGFEDSASIMNYTQDTRKAIIKVGVIKLPHISNFTDFEPLIVDSEIELSFISLIKRCLSHCILLMNYRVFILTKKEERFL